MANENQSEAGAKLAEMGNKIENSASVITGELKDKELFKRIDTLHSMLEGLGESTSLEKERHDLKVKESDQNHTIKKRDSDLLITFKQWIIRATLIFIAINLLNLFFFLKGCYSIDPKSDWHLALALVIGSFTSAFGALALLLKGVFQSSKSEDNLIPSVETLKEILPLIKDLKP